MGGRGSRRALTQPNAPKNPPHNRRTPPLRVKTSLPSPLPPRSAAPKSIFLKISSQKKPLQHHHIRPPKLNQTNRIPISLTSLEMRRSKTARLVKHGRARLRRALT